MNKLSKYFLVVALVAVPFLAFAAEFRGGEQTNLGASEQIGNDLYMAGGTVTSSGSVAGDLVAGGGNIMVNGTINADLMAAGGNVTILSDVVDDVRVGGGTVVINGNVGGDLIAGGGQVTIGGNGIKGDVIVGGGTVRIDAPVGGNLSAGGGSIYLNSPVTGNVSIVADSLTLGSGALIHGNLTYKSSKKLTMEAGAQVLGETTYKLKSRAMVKPALFAFIFSVFFVAKFFMLLVCALVVGLMFRRYSKKIVAISEKRPAILLAKGLVLLIALPIISVLLLMTVVGVPLGVLGILGFVGALICAWIVSPIILGSLVYRYFSKKDLEVSWKTILSGVVLYALLGIVPVVGWLVQCFFMILALGSVAAFKWQIVKEWR